MSEQNQPKIKQEDQKILDELGNFGNVPIPPQNQQPRESAAPSVSPRAGKQPSVLSKKSTLSIDEIITGVGHDKRKDQSQAQSKVVEQCVTRGSNADIETVIEENYPNLTVQVTSRSAKNRGSKNDNSKLSGPNSKTPDSSLDSKERISGTGAPRSHKDSVTKSQNISKSANVDQDESRSFDQLQETSRSSQINAKPIGSQSPFRQYAPITVQDFRVSQGPSRAVAHLQENESPPKDTKLMSQSDYQTYLKNKLRWDTSNVNKTFQKIPTASGKSTSRKSSVEMVKISQDSITKVQVGRNFHNDSLLSTTKEMEGHTRTIVCDRTYEKLAQNDHSKVQNSQRGPHKETIYPPSHGVYPSTLGRSATNDLSPQITQSSVVRATGSEAEAANQTNQTVVCGSVSPDLVATTVSIMPQLEMNNQAVGNTQSITSQQSQNGFDDLFAIGPSPKNEKLQEKLKTTPSAKPQESEVHASAIEEQPQPPKPVEDNFKEFNKFAKLLPVDKLDSNQKTLILNHLALESQRSQFVGRNRILNEVMKGQFDDNVTQNINDILQKHNNDELALENYVKKRIAQPKSFVEVAKIKHQFSQIRGKVKTQGEMRITQGGSMGHQSNSVQISQRLNSQGKPQFMFKPKLSLYATNNSFTTALPSQRGKSNQISYRLQLQTPKSNFLSGQQSSTVPVALAIPSISNTFSVNTPVNAVKARHLLKQSDIKDAAEAQGGLGLGASLNTQYRRNKGQQAQSFKQNNYHKQFEISETTPLLDQLIMTKAGNKKMCQRELRNMQKVMLKTKIANKPKYLWGASDGEDMSQTIGALQTSTLVSVENNRRKMVFKQEQYEGQEAAMRNMVLSDKTKDSLYQAEDSARSKGFENPVITETSSPFTMMRGADMKQVLSQQHTTRGQDGSLKLLHTGQVKTAAAANAEFQNYDPKLSHLAKDWGFHQDAATLGSIMSDKTHRSKINQDYGSDLQGDLLGHSINLKMLRPVDEKEPANISYMCMQMKQKFIDEKKLRSQKTTVRALANKFNQNKKENNHIAVRREYQYKTVTYRNKWDLALPNDDVCNGGFFRKYQLLKTPNATAQEFQRQVASTHSTDVDKTAYQSMSHPSHFTKTEKIIRYEAAKMAQAQDLNKVQGSTSRQVSMLDAMYDNYYDAAKETNIGDFQLMKTVDKCLEKKLNQSRQTKRPVDKLSMIARQVDKAMEMQNIRGPASETNQILINALYSQTSPSAVIDNASSAQYQNVGNKGDMSFEYSDAEASHHNMMTALLPSWNGNNESNNGMYCYYKPRANDSRSPKGSQHASPRIPNKNKLNINVQDGSDSARISTKYNQTIDTPSQKVRVIINDKVQGGKTLDPINRKKPIQGKIPGIGGVDTPPERTVALARHQKARQPGAISIHTGYEGEKPVSGPSGESRISSPCSPITEYKSKPFVPPLKNPAQNSSLFSFKKESAENQGQLAIQAKQIYNPSNSPGKSRVGKVSTMSIQNNLKEGASISVGQQMTRDQQHYLSQTGKASTLYEEMVSNNSKPVSKDKRDTSGSPMNQEADLVNGKNLNAQSEIGTQKDQKVIQVQRLGQGIQQHNQGARNTQSSQSPRVRGILPVENYAQMKDLQRPLLMMNPAHNSNQQMHYQNVSGTFGGVGSIAQSQMIAQQILNNSVVKPFAQNSGTTSPGFINGSTRKCYLIKPNESSNQRQSNSMVGRSVMAKKIQEAKSRQEKYERLNKSKKTGSVEGYESIQQISNEASVNLKQRKNIVEKLGSGRLNSDPDATSGTNVQNHLGSGPSISSPKNNQKAIQEQLDKDIKSKEWGQLGLKTYEMQVLLSTSQSRGSQKYDAKNTPKEISVDGKSNNAPGQISRISKSRMRENSVNLYPPGVGRVTPTNNSQITKGEQVIAQAAEPNDGALDSVKTQFQTLQ